MVKSWQPNFINLSIPTGHPERRSSSANHPSLHSFFGNARDLLRNQRFRLGIRGVKPCILQMILSLQAKTLPTSHPERKSHRLWSRRISTLVRGHVLMVIYFVAEAFCFHSRRRKFFTYYKWFYLIEQKPSQLVTLISRMLNKNTTKNRLVIPNGFFVKGINFMRLISN